MKNFARIFELVFGLLIFAFDRSREADPNEWGYKTGKSFKDPSQWKTIKGSSCGGRRQSPIDIQTEATQYWPALSPIKLENISSLNNQSTVVKDPLALKLDLVEKWRISFGNEGCLTPFTIHWHWGSDDSQGSEHTVNNKKYPLEGHLVSYDCNIYNSYQNALSGPSGLHVIGFFYEIGSNDSTIDLVLKSQLLAPRPLKSVSIPELNLTSFLPKNLEKYFRYEGSLTTPDCVENVIWTVLNEKLSVGKDQLRKLRTLKYDFPESGDMVDNYRPVVKLTENGDYVKRIVYSSFNISPGLKSNLLLILASGLLVRAKL